MTLCERVESQRDLANHGTITGLHTLIPAQRVEFATYRVAKSTRCDCSYDFRANMAPKVSIHFLAGSSRVPCSAARSHQRRVIRPNSIGL